MVPLLGLVERLPDVRAKDRLRRREAHLSDASSADALAASGSAWLGALWPGPLRLLAAGEAEPLLHGGRMDDEGRRHLLSSVRSAWDRVQCLREWRLHFRQAVRAVRLRTLQSCRLPA